MIFNENIRNNGKIKDTTYKMTHILLDDCPRVPNLISK